MLRLKVRKASKDVEAQSDLGRTRCSEHEKVWGSLLAYCRELRGISGELNKEKWICSWVFPWLQRSTGYFRTSVPGVIPGNAAADNLKQLSM